MRCRCVILCFQSLLAYVNQNLLGKTVQIIILCIINDLSTWKFVYSYHVYSNCCRTENAYTRLLIPDRRLYLHQQKKHLQPLQIQQRKLAYRLGATK